MNGCIDNYVSTVQPAWAAAVTAAYPGAPDAAQYIAAWSDYTDEVVTAWENADGALTDAENGSADTTVGASIAHLSSVSAAAHTAARTEVNAMMTAMIAATDARKTYAIRYTNAAVDKAKTTVAADATKAKEMADAEKRENDKLADSYETAVRDAEDAHKDAVNGNYDQIKQAADGYLEDAYEIARAIQSEAETNVNDAVQRANGRSTTPRMKPTRSRIE